MLSCERIREQLPQYVADGELPLAGYAVLRIHLTTCAVCQDYLERLREVEGALRTFPRVSPPPGLATRIVRAVASERQGIAAQRPVFSWELWAPVLIIILALLTAAMFIPPSSIATSLPQWEASVAEWSEDVTAWSSPMQLGIRPDVFWAIWLGIFATTAGIGISIALSSWNQRHSERLGELEAQVADTANRLWDQARRAN